MKKKIAKLGFKIRIENFYTRMKVYISFMLRDKDRFAAFGITEDKIKEAESRLEEFAEIPTDAELLGNQVTATQEKDALGEKVKNAITAIMTRVSNKYGNDSGIYHKFGVNSISKLDGGELGSCARRVCRVAAAMLTDLASEGLTQEIIGDLHDLQVRYETALGKQEDAIADRDIATEERIGMANEIYETMVKYCNTGRKIWQSENEARYNDYIIYDTPSGTSEPETNSGISTEQPAP